jgi:hypothetical protein
MGDHVPKIMRFNPKSLPDSVRRCMPKEERTTKELMTQAEADEVFDARSHRKLQELVVEYLKMKGVRYIEAPAFGKKTRLNKGAPDVRFVFKGVPFAFEFKVGADKQSDAQKEVQQLMDADGWTYLVIRDLDQVRAVLNF